MDRQWKGIALPEGVEVRGDTVSIRFRYQGQRYRELALEATKGNIAAAKAKRAEVLAQISLGTFDYAKAFPNSVRVERAGQGSDRPMRELFERFIERLQESSSVKGSTKHSYALAVRSHWLPALGKVRARDLGPGHIKDYILSLKCGRKSVKNALIPLRMVIEDAVEDGELKVNPLAAINVKKLVREKTASTYNPQPFTEAERAAIFKAAAKHSPMYANMLKFWMFTGLRTGELFALRWSDIDFDKGIVKVRRVIEFGSWEERDGLKTEAGLRDIVLLPPAREALEAQRQHTVWGKAHVFINAHSKQFFKRTDIFARHVWARILADAKVEYRSPYQCRHTYGSMMLARGEDPRWIAEQMGHANVEMLFKVYGRKRIAEAVSGGYRMRNNKW